MDRFINEACLRIARRALVVVRPCLRPEEAAEAFREFHELASEEILRLLQAQAIRQQRLDPTGGGQ